MQINGIHKTKIISFPRSGHHLLVRGLQAALNEELVYCEPYISEHNMEVSPYTNVQKSHDFNLDEPIDPSLKYIIQIRGFEQAIKSWYKIEDLEQPFEEFYREKREYYDGFLSKWVFGPVPNTLFVSFHDITTNKIPTVLKAIEHITDIQMDESRYLSLNVWEQSEDIRKEMMDRKANVKAFVKNYFT